MTSIQRELARIQGLGDCPAGYFEEAGQCLVQTQSLANSQGGVFSAPTQYYPGIYGPTAISPVGIRNPGLELLSPGIKAAIEAAGHSITCKQVKNCAGPVCADVQMCSVDGGDYDRAAYAINAAPGALLVELGAKVPLFAPTAAPRSAQTAPPTTATKVPAATAHTGGTVPTTHTPAQVGHNIQVKTTPANEDVVQPGTGFSFDPSELWAAAQKPALGTQFPWYAVIGVALVGGALLLGGRR